MSDGENKKNIQSSDKVLTDQNKAEVFLAKYQALCEEYGMRLVISPAWASTNHGSFELILQTSVGLLPKENK